MSFPLGIFWSCFIQGLIFSRFSLRRCFSKRYILSYASKYSGLSVAIFSVIIDENIVQNYRAALKILKHL